MVDDPRRHYRIETPALLSISGGRTSGYMLYQIMDAYDGKLPADTHVVFCNTGKEAEPTLQFLRECSARWGVRITWLEFKARAPSTYEIVYFENAARKGEPFERLIDEKRYIPNSLTRFCTSELKVIPKRRYMADLGYKSYTNALGLRADEPKRVASFRQTDGVEFIEMPLFDAGITKPDVLDWWGRQPFDLQLAHEDDGNCDRCFLKGQRKIAQAFVRDPASAAWWIRQEEKIGHWFMKGRKSYSHLLQIAQGGPMFADVPDDAPVACTCDVQ